jgi:Lar family restriction alleviation protein
MKFVGDVASCPFCGSHKLIFEQENVGAVRIRCECGATGPLAVKTADIVYKWNNRTNVEMQRINISK